MAAIQLMFGVPTPGLACDLTRLQLQVALDSFMITNNNISHIKEICSSIRPFLLGDDSTESSNAWTGLSD